MLGKRDAHPNAIRTQFKTAQFCRPTWSLQQRDLCYFVLHKVDRVEIREGRDYFGDRAKDIE